jgi:hypothetical protein
LNSAELGKDVLRHKNWNQQLKEDLKVVECLEGKVVGEDTVADRSSEEFCEALPSGH